MNSDSNNPFVLLWENRKENLTERYEAMQMPGGVMFKFWIQQEPNPPDVSLEFVPGICLEHEEDGSFYLVKKPDIDSFAKYLDDSKKRVGLEGQEGTRDDIIFPDGSGKIILTEEGASYLAKNVEVKFVSSGSEEPSGKLFGLDVFITHVEEGSRLGDDSESYRKRHGLPHDSTE